jgi:hypothetical protein
VKLGGVKLEAAVFLHGNLAGKKVEVVHLLLLLNGGMYRYFGSVSSICSKYNTVKQDKSNRKILGAVEPMGTKKGATIF